MISGCPTPDSNGKVPMHDSSPGPSKDATRHSSETSNLAPSAPNTVSSRVSVSYTVMDKSSPADTAPVASTGSPVSASEESVQDPSSLGHHLSGRNSAASSLVPHAPNTISPRVSAFQSPVSEPSLTDMMHQARRGSHPGTQDSAQQPSRSEHHNSGTIALSDVDLTFAVDCSGSTNGDVLREEKSAIYSISELLSHEAQTRVMILPWNDEAEEALSLEEVEDMYSSGGTDPTVLLRDRHYRQALRNSSLWVLITDGYISDDLVREFSDTLGEASLHGTASIVICVGRAPIRPFDGNISVGKSVFATVPDCLFLYHDIRVRQAYMLQCKGRFRSLLPDPKSSIVLDNDTDWKDLPKMDYETLRNFAVPQKRNLSMDTVVLTSGSTFSLSDVYNDTLESSLTNEILSNDDDLKTLLMTASTRGRKEDVKRWISKKQLNASDPVWAPRNDIEHRAFRCIEKMVTSSRDSTNENAANLKDELRSAHEQNWSQFANTMIAEKQEAELRTIVIADATARLRLDDHTPSSPGGLGPVSPSISGPRYTESYVEDYDRSVVASDTKRNRRSKTRHNRNSPDPGVLFTQGYKYLGHISSGENSASEHFEGTCSLCTRSGQVMALVLKRPEDEELTPNYPTPGQHAKHMFPFVLGNYPDVDIVAQEIYCEACTVYLKLHGQSPKAACVVGALPLVQTHGHLHRFNLQSWTETLISAFEGRFHEDIVISVFLAVLYNTLDDLTAVDSGENTHLTRALRWACRNLLQSLIVCRDTTTTPLGQSPAQGARSSAPLADTIPRLLKDAMNGLGPYSKYPVDGFLVLILAARDVDNENCERGTLRCVVWLRLMTHIVEEHFALMGTASRERAKNLLAQIVYTKASDVQQANMHQPLKTRKLSVPTTALEGTHLLSSTDLQTFQRLGTLFTYIGTKCCPALAVLLHYLLEYSPMCKTSGECFTSLKKEAKLRKLFCAPEDVDLARATALIADLDSPLQG